MSGSPTENLKPLFIAAGVVFALSLALYSRTLAPTVTLVDSGELIVAARALGVAHPPGLPLYVLLTHIATLVPLGNAAARVNFASALFAALATAVLVLLVGEMILNARLKAVRKKDGRKVSGKKKAKRPPNRQGSQIDPDPPVAPAWLAWLVPALVAGMLLAFSRTLWAFATIAEVYTLNALLILVVFFLMFRWRRKILESAGRGGGKAESLEAGRHNLLYGAAFIFGLALGAHHVTVAVMLPALAWLVLATEGVRFFKSKDLLYAALAAAAGLAIYAYLPVAASRSPVINWGDPRTFERFWWHVSGKQFQVFFSFSVERMFGQIGEFIKLAAREFGPWWLPLGLGAAAAGFVSLLNRARVIWWFLIIVASADLVVALNYEIAEDKEAYYIPVFIALAISAGFGVEWFIRMASRASLPAGLRPLLIAAIVLAVPAAALAGNLPYNDRSRYFIAEDYVSNILATVEPQGMLLTQDWQVYSPLLYYREIENRRPDVVSIDINLLRRSWYFDYLSRSYPRLVDETRDKVEAFLEDLKGWERDPDVYDRDISLNQRINSRFIDMILSFVITHQQTGPVYITQDMAVNRESQNADLTRQLAATYQLVPQGLVFRLSSARGFQEPAVPRLALRGLADGTLKFEQGDVVMLKVLPVYTSMMVNTGRYLAAHGRHEQAIEFYRQALALDAGFKPAEQLLNDSLKAVANK